MPDRWFGTGLIALGAGLAVNSLLGPFATVAIDYHFSETLINQTIGLDAVSLLVVAPLLAVAGVVALRGHRLAALLATGRRPPASPDTQASLRGWHVSRYPSSTHLTRASDPSPFTSDQ